MLTTMASFVFVGIYVAAIISRGNVGSGGGSSGGGSNVGRGGEGGNSGVRQRGGLQGS
jgi:hypothetical protein